MLLFKSSMQSETPAVTLQYLHHSPDARCRDIYCKSSAVLTIVIARFQVHCLAQFPCDHIFASYLSTISPRLAIEAGNPDETSLQYDLYSYPLIIGQFHFFDCRDANKPTAHILLLMSFNIVFRIQLVFHFRGNACRHNNLTANMVNVPNCLSFNRFKSETSDRHDHNSIYLIIVPYLLAWSWF